MKEKREIIKSNYTFDAYVNLDYVDAIHQVLLGVLLQTGQNKHINCRSANFCPTYEGTIALFVDLLKHRLISVEDFNVDSFSDDTSQIIEFENIFFDINIDMYTEQAQRILYGAVQLSPKNKVKLWRGLGAQILIQFFVYSAQGIKLNITICRDKISKTSSKILQYYSILQGMYIINIAIGKTKLKLLEENYTQDRASIYITNCLKGLFEKSLEENWIIRNNYEPDNLNVSLAQQYIFDKVLLIEELGLTECPNEDIFIN